MAQTLRQPRQFESPEAIEAAEMEVRLVHVMAAAWLAQHVRKAAVHFSIQVGPRETLERRLNDWIGLYVRDPGESEAPPEHQRRPLNGAIITLKDHHSAADQCFVMLWMRQNLSWQSPFNTLNNRIVFTLPHVHRSEV